MLENYKPLRPSEQTRIVRGILDSVGWMRSKVAKERMKDKGSSISSVHVDALDLVFQSALIHNVEPLDLLYSFLMSTWAQYADMPTRDGMLALAQQLKKEAE